MSYITLKQLLPQEIVTLVLKYTESQSVSYSDYRNNINCLQLIKSKLPYKYENASIVYTYNKHKKLGATFIVKDIPKIIIYSFGVHLEEHQPSGTVNFSRIETPII